MFLQITVNYGIIMLILLIVVSALVAAICIVTLPPTKTERKQQEARKKDLLRQIRGDRISEALYSGRIYVKGNNWCTNMSHPDNIKFINNTIESVKKMDICDKQC